MFLTLISNLLRLVIFPVPRVGYTNNDEIITLETSSGNKISAKYRENPDSDLVIIYSHGNGEDISHTQPLIELIWKAGYSVLLYDYSGYGTSEGSPSIDQTYFDIQAAYDYLTKNQGISTDDIIVYGRSVGGGPSVHLAANNKIGGLILESTFASLLAAKTSLIGLPFDKYPNYQYIGQVRVPVLIMHGKKDITVLSRNSEILYDKANKPKKIVFFQQSGHNNIQVLEQEKYIQALVEFRKTYK